MQFHLKTREEPLFAAVYNPDQQPNELYRNLGFEQSWQQWSDSQKPEGRQEKLCIRISPTAPVDEPVKEAI